MTNYIVSARKYRPSTFSSVVGQKALKQTLKNAIASKKLAHAYLFCGPRGVGKTTCARIFAKTINCFCPTANGEACNECESCLSFNEQRSYNISELDAASNNSVDDIRQLTEQVRIPPQIGEYKVFIIDEVHMLSTSAFNAFLKTLEEPPHHIVFILATTEKNKILPTILSRCQIYDFHRITSSDMVDHLQYVAQEEGIVAEPEALNVIAQKADGGMRDALSIFDQVAGFSDGNITYLAAIENLNVLDYDYYFKLIDAFLGNRIFETLLLFDEILNKGFDAQYFVSGLSNHLRDLLVCRDESTLRLLEVGASVVQHYREQALQCEPQFLLKAIGITNQCDLDYKGSFNKKLLVEYSLMRLCQLTAPDAENDKQPETLKKVTPAVDAPQSRQQTPSVQPAHPPVAENTPPTVTALPPKAEYNQPAIPTLRAEEPTQEVKASPLRRRPTSISIKQSNSTEESVVQNAVAIEEMSTPVFDDQLQKAWLEFAQAVPSTEFLLTQAMESCPPKMINATQLEIILDNPDQVARLNDKGTDLMLFLKQRLRNSRLELIVRESEKNEMKKFLSDRQKFDIMAEQNQYAIQFKNKFGLEIE